MTSLLIKILDHIEFLKCFDAFIAIFRVLWLHYISGLLHFEVCLKSFFSYREDKSMFENELENILLETMLRRPIFNCNNTTNKKVFPRLGFLSKFDSRTHLQHALGKLLFRSCRISPKNFELEVNVARIRISIWIQFCFRLMSVNDMAKCSSRSKYIRINWSINIFLTTLTLH